MEWNFVYPLIPISSLTLSQLLLNPIGKVNIVTIQTSLNLDSSQFNGNVSAVYQYGVFMSVKGLPTDLCNFYLFAKNIDLSPE